MSKPKIKPRKCIDSLRAKLDASEARADERKRILRRVHKYCVALRDTERDEAIEELGDDDE